MSLESDSRYRQLYRVVSGIVTHRDLKLYDDFGVVVGTLDDPSAVEVALALWVFGRKLVGVDWIDILKMAGDGVGLARVVPRVKDVETELSAFRLDLASRGFDDGFVLIQLFSFQDEVSQDLQALDRLVTRLFARVSSPILFTSILDSPLSRTVLIGFKREFR